MFSSYQVVVLCFTTELIYQDHLICQEEEGLFFFSQSDTFNAIADSLRRFIVNCFFDVESKQSGIIEDGYHPYRYLPNHLFLRLLRSDDDFNEHGSDQHTKRFSVWLHPSRA